MVQLGKYIKTKIMIAFIFFSLIATTKAFIDTLIFRSGKSIFPTRWSPFETYNRIPLFLGLYRLDPFHIAVFVLIANIITFGRTYHVMYGSWDIAILLILWGIFFEVPWRLFYKK
jgi:hypothetical protein